MMVSQSEAKTAGSLEVGLEHLLLGLCAADKRLLSSSKLDLEKGRRILRELRTSSFVLGLKYISTDAIVIALVDKAKRTDSIVDFLAKLGVADGGAAIKAAALKKLEGDVAVDNAQRAKVMSKGGGSSIKGKSALAEFCRDLCEEARAGRIDPVTGRDKEVARVIQILARRSKNNPLLLGEPGVGKTAIAEGLALAIVGGGEGVPAFLLAKRVMSLDMGLLIAGAKERGELELRVTRLLQAMRSAGDVILMIDEVHTLVGAGSSGRGLSAGAGLDVSNLLKPPLARGHLQVIGATTLGEFRKYLERDAALERRFQPVHVGEASPHQALAILGSLQARYEHHHGCAYTPAALQAAVTLSARYVADRFLPDKAIDLMDEAGSRARIRAFHARRPGGTADALAALQELHEVQDAKAQAIKEDLWEEAALLHKRALDMTASDLAGAPPRLPRVDVADIEAVVSTWTGIDVQRLGQDEQARLLQLASVLGERIIGQGEAVRALARAMWRARTGLKDPRRPIAAMLFAGGTGVGKTETTKVLAEQYFGSTLLRFDMSEFMERHSVAKLVGAPPGYIGFSEGGKLTEAIRRQPFSVVLFDEIEKAHPDVFNLMLQILEDGRLTDSQGRTVSFANALVVMTSNVGSAAIAKGGGGLGFQLGVTDEEASYGRIRALVTEELKQFFRPELLNRLDEVVVFRALDAGDMRRIADLELAQLAQRLAARGVGLEVSGAVMALICARGYDQAYGARPLRRALTSLLEDPIADALLAGRLPTGAKACVVLDAAGAVTVLPQLHDAAPPVVSGIVASTGLSTKRRESINVSA
ncbi:hypothetical protein WJX81_006674 [Elliptochloris bilobata]|uniref:Uncharacterized protein n=1 Tax=Elliptochloris bilobata TaxID=381761 RepID=A0AAW1RK01_9CHLO